MKRTLVLGALRFRCARSCVSDPGDGTRPLVRAALRSDRRLHAALAEFGPTACFSHHHRLHRHRRTHHLSGRYSSHITYPPASAAISSCVIMTDRRDGEKESGRKCSICTGAPLSAPVCLNHGRMIMQNKIFPF